MNPIFQEVNNLFTKENSVTTSSKVQSLYMLNRMLSMSPQGFMAAMDCNQSQAPEWARLMFLFYSIDKQPAPRVQYKSNISKKESISPGKQKVIDRVQSKFGTNEFHTEQIIKLLEKQGFNTGGE